MSESIHDLAVAFGEVLTPVLNAAADFLNRLNVAMGASASGDPMARLPKKATES